MNIEVLRIISHTVISVSLIIAGVVVTVTGNDATALWAAFFAYLGGGIVEKVTNGKGHNG